MENNSYRDEDINLREIGETIWNGKALILKVMLVIFIVTSLFLHFTDREYTVSMTLIPVSEEDVTGDLASSVGGLASLAGVDLPTGVSSDFSSFETLLISDEISSRLMKNENLIKKVFAGEWNENKQNYEKIPSVSKSVISLLKNILAGDAIPEYIPPNSARLTNFIFKNVDISKDKDTGFLEVFMESENFGMATEVLRQIVLEADMLLREKYIETGSAALEFYQAKINQTITQEHRDALVKLIIKEEQKLMLASRGKAFIADILLGPTKSLVPTFPKSGLFIVFSIFLGLILGIGVVFVRKSIVDESPK